MVNSLEFPQREINHSCCCVTTSCSYWSADNIYATQNGGNYQFYIDEDTSTAVPLGQQLWEDLFKNATLWGLRTYEQVRILLLSKCLIQSELSAFIFAT